MAEEDAVPQPQLSEETLSRVIRCRTCLSESSVRDLRRDDYLPMLDGFFCRCDSESERPLLGLNYLTGVVCIYLKFSESVGGSQ